MIIRPAITVRQFVPGDIGHVEPEYVALAVLEKSAAPAARPRRL